MTIAVVQQPSASDKRAAQALLELSRNTGIFPIVRTYFTNAGDEEWPEGHLAFNGFFGQSRNFFQGAIEYVRLATGWGFPVYQVVVQVKDRRRGDGISGGWCARLGQKQEWMTIFWDDLEFLETVMHETVHLFWPGSAHLRWPPRSEEWIEAQAVRLAEGLRV